MNVRERFNNISFFASLLTWRISGKVGKKIILSLEIRAVSFLE